VALADSVARQPGMTFERGIGHALTAILASPRFLFRAEVQAEPNNPAKLCPSTNSRSPRASLISCGAPCQTMSC